MGMISCSSAMPELPQNWATEWQAAMAFFLAKDKKVYKIYVVHKETLAVYHVVDFPGDSTKHGLPDELACAYWDGKLYLVGDRCPRDVHVCDLTSPEPYVWKLGPPLHSVKEEVLLVPFKGMIFAISNPVVDENPEDDNPVASFEVWDTNANHEWETLPDPPFPDYSSHLRAYGVMSYAVLDDLLYFVFDNTGRVFVEDDYDYDSDCEEPTKFYPHVGLRIKAFDPKLKQWVSRDGYDERAWYVDLCARRSIRGVTVTDFVDPSMRCFLLDPQDTGEYATAPCFYSVARTAFGFNSPSLHNVLREYYPPVSTAIEPHDFLTWFQLHLRPQLSPIRGLCALAKALILEHNLRQHTFLPSYHERDVNGDGEPYWTVRVVAFRHRHPNLTQCVVGKFRLLVSNVFEAKDLQVHIQTLSNMPGSPSVCTDNSTKYFKIP